MSRIIFVFWEVSPAAAVLIPIYFLLNKARFRNSKKSIVLYIFSCYLAAVYALVGMPNITYFRLEMNLNLIPIWSFVADWRNSILNVLLFVPLGVMLPILWEKYRTGEETVLFGFGMSLVIELLQIFTFRATDINDLITNVLGTFFGFKLAKLLLDKFPSLGDMVSEDKAGELYLVCAVTWGVMFFIHPVLSPVVWNWVRY